MSQKISIIVPIYNVEKYLNKCVDSLIKQTYKNIEIILVNDGSPDYSPEICDDFSIQDSRIKVIHKKNGGLSDARNAGIEVANGDYIMFLDGDDYAEVNMVEKAVGAALKYNSDIVIWGYYADYVDREENLISTNIIKGINGYYEEDTFTSVPLNNEVIGLFGYAWNKMYRAKLIKEDGYKFTKGLSLVEDIVFNGPLLEKCNSITFIDQPLIHYMQRPRETLGAKFYENYFELKQLAIKSVESLMISWGYSEKEILQVIGDLGFNSLKSTIRSLSQATNYTQQEKLQYINKLLFNQRTVEYISLVNADNIKDKLILLIMKNRKTRLLLTIYKIRR